jgi:hypothetical protein
MGRRWGAFKRSIVPVLELGEVLVLQPSALSSLLGLVTLRSGMVERASRVRSLKPWTLIATVR